MCSGQRNKQEKTRIYDIYIYDLCIYRDMYVLQEDKKLAEAAKAKAEEEAKSMRQQQAARSDSVFHSIVRVSHRIVKVGIHHWSN